MSIIASSYNHIILLFEGFGNQLMKRKIKAYKSGGEKLYIWLAEPGVRQVGVGARIQSNTNLVGKPQAVSPGLQLPAAPAIWRPTLSSRNVRCA
jgi:hypothetical protein